MSNKTVLQSIIAKFEKLKESAPNLRDAIYIDGVLTILNAALPAEKKMIMDAYWGGLEGTMNDYSEAETLSTGTTIGIKAGGGAEKYYNETFNPNI